MPTPSPTPAEVVTLMELMGENNYGMVLGLVNASTEEVSSAKWAATLLDIPKWEAVRDKTTKVTGKVDVDKARTRAEIRERVRLRYGLTAYVGADVEGGNYGHSCSVPVEFRF
jgi:hypothetical protein